MQIHFIWINDYGYIKNTGINLSCQFNIDFKLPTGSNIGVLPILEISHNQEFIPNFFDKSNITNVSAIIGKNGAGKSSILNYIKSNLPSGLEANVLNDLFVYSLKGEDEIEIYNIIESVNMPINLIDHTGLFTKYTYGNLPSIDTFRFTGHLAEAEYIYYSYFLEFNADLSNWSGLRNISTTALLADERRRIVEENRDQEVRSQLLSESSDLDNLALTEVAKAIQFLIAPEARELPFAKPEELFININLNDRLFFNERNSSHSDVFNLLLELDNRGKTTNVKEGVVNNVLMGILINFLINERKYSSGNPYIHKVDLKKDDTLRGYILRFFGSMENITFVHEGQNVSIPKYHELSKLIPEFLLFIEETIDRELLIPGPNPLSLKLKLNNNTEAELINFRYYYLRIKGISSFFDFRWRSLSTGEQSYLSFMARFYHIKNHEHGDLKKNLVIMIDEGDAGYHPEWQRMFFNTTLNFLSNLFTDHSVQLIFTANTPFLSSDLPKSNILFIDKIDEKISIFHGRENNRQDTFGANIHTLFSNSFYMNGILIGDFAKKRLDDIIKYLNSKTERTPNENYKKTINIIGEPILKNKLRDMWNEKFGIDEELLRLQERILEINKIKEAQKLKRKKK